MPSRDQAHVSPVRVVVGYDDRPDGGLDRRYPGCGVESEFQMSRSMRHSPSGCLRWTTTYLPASTTAEPTPISYCPSSTATSSRSSNEVVLSTAPVMPIPRTPCQNCSIAPRVTTGEPGGI